MLLRYYLNAAFYQAASSSPLSRSLYRYLGNLRRRTMRPSLSSNEEYLRRATWLLAQIRANRVNLAPPSVVLDVGTGWCHYYSMVLSLFLSAKFLLFDVVDNRSLAELRARAAWLADNFDRLRNNVELAPRADAEEKLRAVRQAESIDEVYRALNMQYVVDSGGALDAITSDSIDLMFSMDVLEHVERRYFRDTVGAYYRILKPFGVSIHQIGIDDHLSHAGKGLPYKQYLAFPPATWRLLNSRISSQNRLQVSEYAEVFARAGFVLVSCEASKDEAALQSVKVAPFFLGLPREDLLVTRANMVYRKPGKA